MKNGKLIDKTNNPTKSGEVLRPLKIIMAKKKGN